MGVPAVSKNPFTGKKTIRLVDLMHHRGGLVPDPQYPNATVAGELYLQNLDDISNRTDVIDRICRTPLMYAPHTERAYSDVDYMILGLIVEQVVGKRLDEYLQEGVYRRLGLERTEFRPLDVSTPPDFIAATELNGNTRDGNVDFGTRPDGSPVFIRTQTICGQVQDEKAFFYTMSGVSGHAGLFSTADDLGVLLQLMSNEGMYQAVSTSRPMCSVGFSLLMVIARLTGWVGERTGTTTSMAGQARQPSGTPAGPGQSQWSIRYVTSRSCC
ncbi:hypothetical protein JCM18918_223 [Cutibacterium acnes JCM 18918]|nr:hypothetical protein JCM18918_223 [Cutibacterium acnes JCM 18918]